MVDLAALRSRLSETTTLRAIGRVTGVSGLLVRVAVPGARLGDVLHIRRRTDTLAAEVVGFTATEVLALPLGELSGVGLDDEVESTGAALSVPVGEGLLGRVLDGLGRPLDQRPLPPGLQVLPIERPPPAALGRPRIREPLATGVRVLDGLLTVGVGQRIGLFAGSGVGKSSLLGALARGTAADAVVVALVGERGREVGEFLEHSLGAAGLARATVVVATSDAPPVERLHAAHVATTIAEDLRDSGKRVLLLVDSLTRVARAQREIGLSLGEPPARRGYPPSVFALLPRLVERSGLSERGAITAVYTVLVEGSDMDEPIADEVRGLLDGHVILSRNLAERGIYPAVDVPASISRVFDAVVTSEHAAAARKLRAALGLYAQRRDLVALGAYVKGSDPKLDATLALLPDLERFLAQDNSDITPFEGSFAALRSLAQRLPG